MTKLMQVFNALNAFPGYGSGASNERDIQRMARDIQRAWPAMSHLMPTRFGAFRDQRVSLKISWTVSVHYKRQRPTHLYIYPDGRLEFSSYSSTPYYRKALELLRNKLRD